MSILIKGMEMPKHSALDGEKDTFYKGAIVVHKDGTAEMVIFRESAHVFALCNKIHLDKFSLVAVPTPHGRLIDADELQTAIHGCLCENCQTFPCEKGIGCLIEDVFNLLDEAPTIIEAEVSE